MDMLLHFHLCHLVFNSGLLLYSKPSVFCWEPGLNDNACLLLLTLPWGRGQSALLEVYQSQRWWNWTIMAEDCLSVDGEPVLWLVSNWKASRAAYWWLSFPQVMDFSSVSQAAALPFRCGGGLRTWDFPESRATRDNDVTDFQDGINLLLPVQQGWLVPVGKLIQDELTVDVRGPSAPSILANMKEDKKKCSGRDLVFQPSISQPQIFNLPQAGGRNLISLSTGGITPS